MPFLSAFAMMAAAASLVSAAPQRRQDFTRKLGPAPFQLESSLPTISEGVTKVDIDLSDYSAYNWPEDSDQYRCHGTCGILLRISRTDEKCAHPYALPFAKYCVKECGDADPGAVYPTAKKFVKECDFNLNRPAREVSQEEEKKPDSKDQKESASLPESSQHATASTASSATTTTASPSTASSTTLASPTSTTASVSSASTISTSSVVSSSIPTGTGSPSAAALDSDPTPKDYC